MATQGPNLPTAATGNTNTIFAGTLAWTNPTNILAADGSRATATRTLAGTTNTDDLIATGFGFSVPATATINGIQVDMDQLSLADGVTTNGAKLLKAGAAVGTSQTGTGSNWSSVGGTTTYGGSANLWGTTWTPADINASNFGFAIAVAVLAAGGVGGAESAETDWVKVTVTYTVPAPTVTSCSPSSGPTAGGTSVTITGTNFFSGSIGVTFGGTAATSVTFVNSTTITCVTPAHAAGAVNVVVTNPDAQTGTGTSVFTYSAASTNTAAFFAMF